MFDKLRNKIISKLKEKEKEKNKEYKIINEYCLNTSGFNPNKQAFFSVNGLYYGENKKAIKLVKSGEYILPIKKR